MRKSQTPMHKLSAWFFGDLSKSCLRLVKLRSRMEVESVHRSLQRAVRLPFRRLLPKILEPTLNAHGVRINMSLRQSTALSSSSTSFLPSHAAGNTTLDAAMAKELSSSCPVELESRSRLSSSSSSSTKDAIVLSSKATVDITPAHSSNLIERSYNRAWCGRGRGRRDITTSPRSARDFTIAGQS